MRHAQAPVSARHRPLGGLLMESVCVTERGVRFGKKMKRMVSCSQDAIITEPCNMEQDKATLKLRQDKAVLVAQIEFLHKKTENVLKTCDGSDAGLERAKKMIATLNENVVLLTQQVDAFHVEWLAWRQR